MTNKNLSGKLPSFLGAIYSRFSSKVIAPLRQKIDDVKTVRRIEQLNKGLIQAEKVSGADALSQFEKIHADTLAAKENPRLSLSQKASLNNLEKVSAGQIIDNLLFVATARIQKAETVHAEDANFSDTKSSLLFESLSHLSKAAKLAAPYRYGTERFMQVAGDLAESFSAMDDLDEALGNPRRGEVRCLSTLVHHAGAKRFEDAEGMSERNPNWQHELVFRLDDARFKALPSYLRAHEQALKSLETNRPDRDLLEDCHDAIGFTVASLANKHVCVPPHMGEALAPYSNALQRFMALELNNCAERDQNRSDDLFASAYQLNFYQNAIFLCSGRNAIHTKLSSWLELRRRGASAAYEAETLPPQPHILTPMENDTPDMEKIRAARLDHQAQKVAQAKDALGSSDKPLASGESSRPRGEGYIYRPGTPLI